MKKGRPVPSFPFLPPVFSITKHSLTVLQVIVAKGRNWSLVHMIHSHCQLLHLLTQNSEQPPINMRRSSYSVFSVFLRRKVIPKTPLPYSSIHHSLCNPMDSQSSYNGGSQRLINLAQQLRLYKTPPSSFLDENEEERREESEGKVVSQVGFAESSTPIVHPERFKPKKAAVLICLFEDDDGVIRVILTKRSTKLSTHSGEVSLPGGKAEEGDADDAETAVREAKEEIGLDPCLVNVVTVLEPFLSKHLLRVVPVIGILTDKHLFNPVPNADEVDAVFDAPLEIFLKDENKRSEEREWMGDKYLVHFFDYETNNKKFMIWGLTAGILIRAASVVFERPPNFEEQKLNFKVPRLINNDTTVP